MFFHLTLPFHRSLNLRYKKLFQPYLSQVIKTAISKLYHSPWAGKITPTATFVFDSEDLRLNLEALIGEFAQNTHNSETVSFLLKNLSSSDSKVLFVTLRCLSLLPVPKESAELVAKTIEAINNVLCQISFPPCIYSAGFETLGEWIKAQKSQSLTDVPIQTVIQHIKSKETDPLVRLSAWETLGDLSLLLQDFQTPLKFLDEIFSILSDIPPSSLEYESAIRSLAFMQNCLEEKFDPWVEDFFTILEKSFISLDTAGIDFFWTIFEVISTLSDAKRKKFVPQAKSALMLITVKHPQLGFETASTLVSLMNSNSF